MVFIRISLMTPQPGQERRVEDLLDQLLNFYRGRQGFITAYRLMPDRHTTVPQLGRVSIWESEEDAHRTASEQRDLSLQSELKLFVDDATHQEHSFQGIPVKPGG